MKKFSILISVLLGICGCVQSPEDNGRFLELMMEKHPEKFQTYLQHRDDYEIQIIYTRIDRDEHNQPSFTSFYFNVDSSRYFYPASTVKLPLVLMALEKLRRLNIPRLDRNTPMLSDSMYAGQITVHRDTTSANGLPSIGHYARKILVVSDNDAYNRLYEFMGQREINQWMMQKGYTARILHRLERPLTPDQNRHTEAVTFTHSDNVVFAQPMLVNPDSIRPLQTVWKGKGHMKNNSLVGGPFDFTYKNFYPLTSQHALLRALLFPETVSPQQRFDLSDDDRRFVLQYMSQLPGETTFPSYFQDSTLHDASCKFLMYGNSQEKIPSSIRIFNKIGDAYGYMIDNACIIDTENKIEFMLSAVILSNTDEIFNDGVYDYDSIGYPFMRELGQLVYDYEKQRRRKHTPDLSEFKFLYDR